MREIRLTRDRADRGELRHGEAHDIVCAFLRIGHAVDLRLFGCLRPFHGPAELQGFFRHRPVLCGAEMDAKRRARQLSARGSCREKIALEMIGQWTDEESQAAVWIMTSRSLP